MNPLKNLLLAVDFTEHSTFTLQSAISFCKENKSTLSLIHIVSVEDVDPKMDIKLKIANNKIEKIAKSIQEQDVEVPHTKVVAGNIEKHTLFFAEAIKADAILIGSGNEHHNKKHRLGGHAEAILRYSSIPVLIIKDTWYPLKGKIACNPKPQTPNPKPLRSVAAKRKYIAQNLPLERES
jgi:nucleotide-binding universal stress UspA family protein